MENSPRAGGDTHKTHGPVAISIKRATLCMVLELVGPQDAIGCVLLRTDKYVIDLLKQNSVRHVHLAQPETLIKFPGKVVERGLPVGARLEQVTQAEETHPAPHPYADSLHYLLPRWAYVLWRASARKSQWALPRSRPLQRQRQASKEQNC